MDSADTTSIEEYLFSLCVWYNSKTISLLIQKSCDQTSLFGQDENLVWIKLTFVSEKVFKRWRQKTISLGKSVLRFTNIISRLTGWVSDNICGLIYMSKLFYNSPSCYTLSITQSQPQSTIFKGLYPNLYHKRRIVIFGTLSLWILYALLL